MASAPKTVAAAPTAILTVTSTGDGAANAANCPGANCRLRDAIAAASSGDTITFGIPTSDAGYDAVSGVYSIALATVGDNTFGPSALLINKALTIDAGSSQITITRAGSAGTLRLCYVTSAGSLTLKGVRLAGGNAFEGGAIYNQGNVAATGATFHLNNSINRGRGGAVFNTGTGLFTATRTSFQSNSAEGVGGAIYNDSTNATPVSITESDFLNSYSIGYVVGGNTFRSDGHGGAIYNAGRLSVGRSYFGGNQSNYNGGAVYNVSSGRLTVSDSFFELNGPTSFSAGPFYGGAIRNDGMLLVSGATFYTNSANNRGGAVFASGAGSQTTLVNSTFSRNSANYGAAVIGSGSVTVGVYNCTLAENTGFNTVYSELGASVTVANSIVFSTGTQIEFNSFNGSFNLANNIVRGSNPNPQLLALGPYGGPQIGLTGFQNFMYGIPATSPAVDAGDNARIPIDPATNLPFATDQRGVARVQRGNPAAPAAVVDIGAFEIPFVCPAITVINPAATTGTVGAAFGQSFTQTGGGTVGFSTSSTLPPGLSLNSNGTLSGTPTQAGTFPIIVTATDDNNCMGTGTTYNLVIGCPAITAGTPGAGATIHQSYSSSVAASPAAPAGFNYQYALANNTALPPGLMLTPTTGEITGAPTALGQVNFSIKAELFNGATTGCAATQNFSINVTCAANPVVTTTADSGAGSLRQAILDACPGSTITFANGINLITLTSGELLIDRNLTIQGPGANLLTVQRSTAQGTADFRIFTIDPFADPTAPVQINGLTIANGRADSSYNYGGGILNLGTLMLNDSTISGNFVGGVGDGAGIDNERTMTITNSTISGNSGHSGIANYGTLTITNSLISGNSSTTGGGGIYSAGTVTVTNSTISGNSTVLNGGGILSSGTVTVTNSTISGNRVSGNSSGNNGGGIFHFNGSLTLNNSTISGNSANSSGTGNLGGGIFIFGGTVILTNSTITGNSASGGVNNNQGGGIYNFTSNLVVIKNTIIAGNSAASRPDASGIVTSQGNNLIGNNAGLTITPTTGDQIGTPANPINPQLGPLANNGGPTQTHALLPGSPAINAGDNCVLTANGCGNNNPALTTDQRGADFPRQSGSAVDIGAFEAFVCPTITVTNPGISNGTVGAAFSQSFTQTGGGTVSFSTGSTLPPGLSLNSNGTLSGTPTQAGTFPIIVTATESGSNCAGTGTTYTLVIGCPTITVGTPTAAGAPGATYSSSVAATPSVSTPMNYQYSLANNTTLPPGLSLNSSTGAITGTPTAAGNVSFDIKAELFNSNTTTGCSVTATRSINITCPATATLYVNATVAGGLGDGSSWANALPTLSAALARASGCSNVTQIWVAQGTYKPTSGTDRNATFTLRNNLAIYGGFTSGQTLLSQRNPNPATNNTVLSGDIGTANDASDNSFHVVTGGDGTDSSAVLDGFTISGGRTNNVGGGMYNDNSSPTLTNLTFSGNYALQGGGMWNRRGSPTLTNVSFSGNASDNGGGGMVNSIFSNPTLTNVTFIGNYTVQGGGGMYNKDNSSPTLTNVSFSGNFATFGGGIYNLSSNPQIRNSILWGDSGGEISNNNNSNPVVSDSLVQGGYSGTGNLSSDPLFVSSSNLRLLPASPAINAGNNGVANPALPATDLAGNPRIAGGTVDMGAFEANYALAATGGTPQSTTVTTPFANALQATLTEYGQPISGVTINFTAPSSGASASLSSPTAMTNASGQASVTATANGVTGSYQVTAGANGLMPVTFSLTNACPAITLAPAALPNGEVGTAYTQTLTAAPAGGNYSFAVTSGLLPPGLTLNSDGSFGGAPAQTGTFTFRVTATGFGPCAGVRDYTLVVAGCAPVTVTPATLNSGTAGTIYSQTFSATPAGSYSFSVTSGALPVGLALNAATGAITGTPTASGSFSFRIAATAGACGGARDYTLTINCAPITLGALPAATAGASYSQAVGVSPAGSYTFSLLAGSLPAGLSLNPTTGTISGLPSVAGTYSFTIKAQTAGGCAGQQAYSLVVACPTVTLSALPAPTLNSPYSQTVTASPVGGSYSFAVTAGALPAGLVLNPTTGIISGTTTTAGAYSFTVTATGFGSCSGSRTYSGTIAGGGCPSITLADLPEGQPGQFYNNAVTASPAGSYGYAVTDGALPPGLTLFGGFGLLYGYPTQAGAFTFTVTATDANNCAGSRQYSLTIGGAALRAGALNDFSGDRKSDFVLWRAAQAQWLIVDSATDLAQTAQWGQAGDTPVAGDFDGDGKADLAAFGKDGHWRIRLSGGRVTLDQAWGVATDTPVPGDYDGDGKTDLAVWRGAEGNWYILRSSDGRTQTAYWGFSTAPYFDLPVQADYDGDGKTDVAVFRRATGHWYIKLSSDGSVVDKLWGVETDVPVAADYDGDGKADIAVWRGADTNWYVVRSSDGASQVVPWGASALGDAPAPGDYDGDGKADAAVWRATEGRWLVKCSGDGSVLNILNGRRGDTPVSAPRR